MESHALATRFAEEMKPIVDRCGPSAELQTLLDRFQRNPTAIDDQMDRLKKAFTELAGTIPKQTGLTVSDLLQTAFTRSEMMTDLSLPVDPGAFKAALPNRLPQTQALLATLPPRDDDAMNLAVNTLQPLESYRHHLQEAERIMKGVRPMIAALRRAQQGLLLLDPTAIKGIRRVLKRQRDIEELENLPIRSTKMMKRQPYCQEAIEGFEADFPLLVNKARLEALRELSHFTVEELREREQLIDTLDNIYDYMMTWDWEPYTSFFLILVLLYLLAKCDDDGAFIQLIEFDASFIETDFFHDSWNAWITQAKSGDPHAKTMINKIGETMKRYSGFTPGRKKEISRMERTLKEINPNRNKTDIFRQIAREALEEEGEKITHKAVQKKADAIKRKFYREQKDTDGFPYPFKHLKREISS